MTLNDETSFVLKWGTLLGLSVIALGLILSICEITDGLLAAGVLILILTPPAGIVVSTICLIREKDRIWVRVALVLIAVLTFGTLFSYLVH